MRWAWLIGPALLGACYGDPDRFNEKQADLLCRLEERCDGDFGVESTPGSSCEDNRIDELSSCAMACDYDEDAARSCIRGIKHALRGGGLLGPNCEYEEGTIEDCARVYTGCAETLDDPLRCDVPEPDLSCAVGDDARSPWALCLVILWWTRRRARGLTSRRRGAAAWRGSSRGSRPGDA